MKKRALACVCVKEADSRKIGREITASDVPPPQGKFALVSRTQPQIMNFQARILLRAALFHLKQMTPCSRSQFGQICAAAKEAFRHETLTMSHTPFPLCAARKF
jgi:hypothetical protein